MDGYVFFEVDNMGNPIYGDKMKELLNCEKEHILFILSAEYQANFSVELIDHKVIIIPEDVLKKIDIAIENEKKFCEDINELEHTVGSNIGVLIEEMRRH